MLLRDSFSVFLPLSPLLSRTLSLEQLYHLCPCLFSPGQLSEEMLDKRPEELDNISTADVLSLFHELQVNQIELGMQNEELHRTQIELEASREKYFDLYDLAPVGYVTLDEKGIILETNLTAAALLGIERNHLVRQSLLHFIFTEDQDTYNRHHKQLIETHQHQECRVRLLKVDGTQLWARLESIEGKAGSGE